MVAWYHSKINVFVLSFDSCLRVRVQIECIYMCVHIDTLSPTALHTVENDKERISLSRIIIVKQRRCLSEENTDRQIVDV